MPSQDPADWFDDVNVHVDDEELLEYAAELESTLRQGGSRIGTAPPVRQHDLRHRRRQVFVGNTG